jgi:hypothetical protein
MPTITPLLALMLMNLLLAPVVLVVQQGLAAPVPQMSEAAGLIFFIRILGQYILVLKKIKFYVQ